MPLSVKRVKASEHQCSACNNEHPEAGALFEVHIRSKNKIQKIYLCESDISNLFTLASNAKLSKGQVEFSDDYTDAMKQRDGHHDKIFVSKSDSTVVYGGKDEEYVASIGSSGEPVLGEDEGWPDDGEEEAEEGWGEDAEGEGDEDGDDLSGWGEDEEPEADEAADDSDTEDGWGSAEEDSETDGDESGEKWPADGDGEDSSDDWGSEDGDGDDAASEPGTDDGWGDDEESSEESGDDDWGL